MGTVSATQIARVRAFNRDYTRRIGVLSEELLDSPYSLTQVRVMYEIAHRSGVTAGELAEELDLDRGYLSRMLKGFETKELLVRTPAPEDGRRQHLRMTPAGMRVFAPLEKRSQEQVRGMLTALDEERRSVLLEAMDTIQNALNEGSARAGGKRLPANGTLAQQLVLRGHRPGDMGWVVQRHGEIYHQEYGWTEEFEALVAEITAEFVRKLDVTRERCWIAEHDGRRVGCIFLVAKDATTAKLRLLLVDPDARGLGVGRKLVAECVQFARVAGYRKIVLWTQETLTAARHLYTEAGFVKTAREPHRSFGHDLVGETWERELHGEETSTAADT
ncbi:MAG TPA: helix-turn-helix domain-containing GNAT family N-acetyltransferase [Steroidobacteraceae bacterium]|nr:helix-turn-helix domain-containing GNAT family N-acetyltransferase [Steroidobacteraceae bacterium]